MNPVSYDVNSAPSSIQYNTGMPPQSVVPSGPNSNYAGNNMMNPQGYPPNMSGIPIAMPVANQSIPMGQTDNNKPGFVESLATELGEMVTPQRPTDIEYDPSQTREENLTTVGFGCAYMDFYICLCGIIPLVIVIGAIFDISDILMLNTVYKKRNDITPTIKQKVIMMEKKVSRNRQIYNLNPKPSRNNHHHR
ncbi:hypothetical protein WA158_004675 [Blastocystis sp. Blastoise]